MLVMCTACGHVGEHEELPDQPADAATVRVRCRAEGCGEVFEIAVWPTEVARAALEQLPVEGWDA